MPDPQDLLACLQSLQSGAYAYLSSALDVIPWLEQQLYSMYPLPAAAMLAAACILSAALYLLEAEMSTVVKSAALLSVPAAVYFLTGSASLSILSFCLLLVPLFPSAASAAVSIAVSAVMLASMVV